MPHIIVKLGSGRDESKKAELAQAISDTVVAVLACETKVVSIAIDDVDPADWPEKVFVPHIAGNLARLYKKPGYGTL
ncbi:MULTISPECIES: tautomerase family protein [unclassified Mesorhizobium]|uniref:tautomerase family protein n=1 Tax=unclassified Mesorhizobium TaxID=325217 RepID=UPI0004896AA6|nr:tautomerase family protein [Mesorhizobium sp. WSM3626]